MKYIKTFENNILNQYNIDLNKIYTCYWSGINLIGKIYLTNSYVVYSCVIDKNFATSLDKNKTYDLVLGYKELKIMKPASIKEIEYYNMITNTDKYNL